MSDPKDNDADNLPEVQKAEIIGPTEESKSEEESGPASFQLIKVEAQFSGPLPPPSILKRYDDIVPGAADRILTMAEEQSKHRRSLEANVLESNTREASRGQWFGFIIGIVGVVGGIGLVAAGFTWPGLAIFLTDVIGLATVFAIGRSRGLSELAEKSPTKNQPDAVQQELPLSS